MTSAALVPVSSGDAVCTATLARHGKSFSFASAGLRPEQRGAAAALYTWCRRADDAVDLAEPRNQSAALGAERSRLTSIYAGRALRDPADAAFQRVVFEKHIPEEYPSELLRGMEMDVVGTQYGTLTDLYLYCHRVAGTVGLMMCHVLGISDERAVRPAAHLGLAMQLTNICRDVAEDWDNGRLYLPSELLEREGLGYLPSLLGGSLPRHAAEPLARVVSTLLDEADDWYASADRGLAALDFRSSLAIRTARRLYAAIGTELRARNCDVLSGRAVVPFSRKLLLAAGAFGQALVGVPARVAKPWRPVELRTVVRFPDGVLGV